MSEEVKVGDSIIRLYQGDITDLEIESFVYYATHDLNLGSGFGTAIAIRGGPTVQQELNEMDPLQTTEAVISAAGEMKADYIIHAVGPRFQEEDIESKLEKTILSALKKAEDKGIKAVAFPAMGAGFYGIPLAVSARVTLTTLKEYLADGAKIKDVVVCLNDNHEFKPFQSQLAALGNK
ncbi:MAG: macro domain-containing protein [FCB group bacterium]|nr:macro domain-containing protein [FCB group bacterium]